MRQPAKQALAALGHRCNGIRVARFPGDLEVINRHLRQRTSLNPVTDNPGQLVTITNRTPEHVIEVIPKFRHLQQNTHHRSQVGPGTIEQRARPSILSYPTLGKSPQGIAHGLQRETRVVDQAQRLSRQPPAITLNAGDELAGHGRVTLSEFLKAQRASEHLLYLKSELLVISDLSIRMSQVLEER